MSHGKNLRRTVVALIAGFLMTACAHASVNKSVRVDDGGQSDGASSVNGSVTVGSDATVTGDVSTVNGRISIDERSQVEDVSTVNGSIRVASNVSAHELETVNGSIRIDEQGRIAGGVSAVNGGIRVDRGSTVSHDVANVNGEIELKGCEVGGSLRTTSGDVDLSDGAVVKGDLRVEKPRSSNWFNRNERKPRIVIGPGSRVEGMIVLEREVDLYISESAEVGGVEGVMSLSDAKRFSGNRP